MVILSSSTDIAGIYAAKNSAEAQRVGMMNAAINSAAAGNARDIRSKGGNVIGSKMPENIGRYRALQAAGLESASGGGGGGGGGGGQIRKLPVGIDIETEKIKQDGLKLDNKSAQERLDAFRANRDKRNQKNNSRDLNNATKSLNRLRVEGAGGQSIASRSKTNPGLADASENTRPSVHTTQANMNKLKSSKSSK